MGRPAISRGQCVSTSKGKTWALGSASASCSRSSVRSAAATPVRVICAACSAGPVTAALQELLREHDALALPSAQVFPFDAGTPWPREVAGRAMPTYHRWMEVTIYASLAGLPVAGVPVGFGPGGLPMGMQLIGRPRGDRALLELVEAYDRATGWVRARPLALRR